MRCAPPTCCSLPLLVEQNCPRAGVYQKSNPTHPIAWKDGVANYSRSADTVRAPMNVDRPQDFLDFTQMRGHPSLCSGSFATVRKSMLNRSPRGTMEMHFTASELIVAVAFPLGACMSAVEIAANDDAPAAALGETRNAGLCQMPGEMKPEPTGCTARRRWSMQRMAGR